MWLFFLIETKMLGSNIQSLKLKLGYNNVLTVDGVGNSGGF